MFYDKRSKADKIIDDKMINQDKYDWIAILGIIMCSFLWQYYLLNNNYITSENPSFIITGIFLGMLVLFLTLSEVKYLRSTFINAFLMHKHWIIKSMLFLFTFLAPILFFTFNNFNMGLKNSEVLSAPWYNFLFLCSIMTTIYTICDILYNYILWNSSNEKYSRFIVTNIIKERDISRKYDDNDIFTIKQELEKYSPTEIAEFINLKAEHLSSINRGVEYRRSLGKREVIDSGMFLMFETISDFLNDNTEIYLNVEKHFRDFHWQLYRNLEIKHKNWKDSENEEEKNKFDIEWMQLIKKYFIVPYATGINYSDNDIVDVYSHRLLSEYISFIEPDKPEICYLLDIMGKLNKNINGDVFCSNITTYILIELLYQKIQDNRVHHTNYNSATDIILKAFSGAIFTTKNTKEIKDFPIKWELENNYYHCEVARIMKEQESAVKILECLNMLKIIESEIYFNNYFGSVGDRDVLSVICDELITEFEKAIYAFWIGQMTDAFLVDKQKLKKQIINSISDNLEIFNIHILIDNFFQMIDKDFSKEIVQELLKRSENNNKIIYIYEKNIGDLKEYHNEEFQKNLEMKYSSTSFSELKEKITGTNIDELLEILSTKHISFKGVTYCVPNFFEEYFFVYSDKHQTELIKIFKENDIFVTSLIRSLDNKKNKIKFNLDKYLIDVINGKDFLKIVSTTTLKEYIKSREWISVDEKTFLKLIMSYDKDVSYIIDKVKLPKEITGEFLPNYIDCNGNEINNYISLFKFLNKNNDKLSPKIIKRICRMLTNIHHNNEECEKLLRNSEYDELLDNLKERAKALKFENMETFLALELFSKD